MLKILITIVALFLSQAASALTCEELHHDAFWCNQTPGCAYNGITWRCERNVQPTPQGCASLSSNPQQCAATRGCYFDTNWRECRVLGTSHCSAYDGRAHLCDQVQGCAYDSRTRLCGSRGGAGRTDCWQYGISEQSCMSQTGCYWDRYRRCVAG